MGQDKVWAMGESNVPDRVEEAGGPDRALSTRDRMFALLRIAVFTGALIWVVLAPVAFAVRRNCAALLLAFAAYGVLTTWLVKRHPNKARRIYLGALIADLVFLFFLFGQTGGIASPFLPAAFLLAALTAFAYGPILGVFAAWAALGCAVVSDLNGLAQRHWSEIPLLVIFVTVTATYVGWLARREASERRDIERLHDTLKTRADELEASYRRCRETREHLVHSERLATIGRMSAEMAHQVRNPLSSFSLNLELLEDEFSRRHRSLSHEAQWLVAAIHKEIDNLAEVTESYLRFAKLPPFHWEHVELNEIVRDILVFARTQIDRRTLTVTQHLESGLPLVRLDRRQLKFAVMNVLTNAIEAMDSGGRLRIRTCRDGAAISLAISDTGVGISKEDLP